jgi:hypothetical protein
MSPGHSDSRQCFLSIPRIEKEQSRPISQVFSVGDVGLFLSEEDWNCLTDPSKYKHPDRTPGIREAWQLWQWPLATIGGNHEPWNRPRAFDSEFFKNKLTYTNAGELQHSLKGLRVVGLSGIAREPMNLKWLDQSWSEILEQVKAGMQSKKNLTYYGANDLHLAASAAGAHILLTHDWPVDPLADCKVVRAERFLSLKVCSKYHFCGHHHRPASIQVDAVQVRALNIISSHNREQGRYPNPGWA